MKYRWISWFAVPGTMTELGKFSLPHPWWISGERCHDGASTVCAAIPVETAEEAEDIVMKSHDFKPADQVHLEMRFNDLKDGSPFGGRFLRAKWMRWPADEVCK